MSSNQDQYIPHRLSPFEKATSGIVAAIIVALLAWVGNGVQQSQIQYSAIQERLLGQSAILIKLQNTVEKATDGRIALERNDAIMTQRINNLDEEVEEIKQLIKR